MQDQHSKISYEKLSILGEPANVGVMCVKWCLIQDHE